MAIFGYFGSKNRYLTAIFLIFSNVWGALALRAIGAARRTVLRTVSDSNRRFAPPWGAKNGQKWPFWPFLVKKPLLYAYFDRLMRDIILNGCSQHLQHTRRGVRNTLNQV